MPPPTLNPPSTVSSPHTHEAPGAARGDVRLLLPAVCAWIAVAATLATPVGWRLVAAAALLLGSLAALVGAGPPTTSSGIARYATAVALTFAAGGTCLLASALHQQTRGTGTLPRLADERATVIITGRVSSDPVTVSARGPSPRDVVLVRLSVSQVHGRGVASSVSSRVLAFGDGRWRSLQWGERVEVRGRLAPAEAGSDVAATLNARGPPRLTGSAPWWVHGAERLRSGLRHASEGLGRDARGLLPGLVVGDTSLQPADLTDAMRATGLTHLSAVSGTNVTIVCVLALAVARGLGLRRRTRLLAAGLVLAGFVMLARPEPSVLRAAVMGAIGLLALGASRRRAGVPAVSCAIVVLLVADPWLARSYGFALSVLATLGLLLWAAPLADRFTRWLPRPLAVALAVPVAAQAACGPVVVLLSGQVSLVSVPANLVVEPLVAPATVLGLAAALASALSGHLAQWLAWLAGVPCSAIAWVARAMADVPLGQLGWPSGAVGAVTLALATLGVAALGPRLVRALRRSPWALAGAVILLLAGCLPLPVGRWPPSGWVLVACDVGQGDALVLSTGKGRGLLVDAGPDPDLVDGCLRRLRISVLDAVLLTHFHADHVEGLPGALRGRRVGVVLTTIVDDPPAEARRVRTWAAAAGVDVRAVRAGSLATLGPLQWRVLWPERVVHEGSVPNNSSAVLRVDVAGLRLLLLGDVEPAAAGLVDRALRSLPDGTHVDVMKVAHHGSALQDPGLVHDASPRLALVSVGAHNDYGHPAPSTLRLLRSTGALVARTDQHGDLAVVGHAGRLCLVTRR
jgi:competence protein ComEC